MLVDTTITILLTIRLILAICKFILEIQRNRAIDELKAVLRARRAEKDKQNTSNDNRKRD